MIFGREYKENIGDTYDALEYGCYVFTKQEFNEFVNKAKGLF